MKKLLHERLREIGQGNYCHSVELDSGRVMLNPSEAANLANEIEKYYIPRPRFEDGEPVQFGDEFINCHGHNNTVSSITYTRGNKDYVSLNAWTKQVLDEPVKRPEPKVLDADGEEIKVGDTVYTTGTDGYNDEEYVVDRIIETDHEIRVFGMGRGWMPPYLLTHREPDSLKKAVDDLGELLNFPMCDDIKLDKVEEVYNRLTAIMERDA